MQERTRRFVLIRTIEPFTLTDLLKHTRGTPYGGDHVERPQADSPWLRQTVNVKRLKWKPRRCGGSHGAEWLRPSNKGWP